MFWRLMRLPYDCQYGGQREEDSYDDEMYVSLRPRMHLP